MYIYHLWSKLFKKIRLSSVINCNIDRTSKIEAGSSVIDSVFGRHSFCGYDCQIVNCDIGSFCSISNRVVIGGGRHPIEWISTSPVFYKGRDSVKTKFSEHERLPHRRTYIGNDVWIGENVLISQGVTIGNGVVIGMGSVVTKNIDNYAIVAGSPAKMLRMRFDEKTIADLMKIEWWDFSDELLVEYAKYISDPNEFIDKVLSR